MKEKVKEYLIPSHQERLDLLKNATIVVDTNVLLSLYRYKKDTTKEFLDLLNEVKDRLWIPYQVAKEFMGNRVGVIYENIRKYDYELKKAKDDFIKNIEKYLPSFSSESNSLIPELDQYITEWIKKRKEDYVFVSEHNDDLILDEILNIFDKRVGEILSEEKLTNLEKEAEERYKKNIPPGYCDKEKDSNKYGDYIIWSQIIEFAKENKKDVILVTNDKKKDWWESTKGKTIGPKYELKREFFDNTNQKIQMYSSSSFYTLYKEVKAQKVNKEVKEDIHSVAEKIYFKQEKNFVDFMMNKLNYLEKKNDKRKETYFQIIDKYKDGMMPEHISEMQKNTLKNIKEDNDKINIIKKKIEKQEEDYEMEEIINDYYKTFFS